MLATKHDCHVILAELSDSGIDISDDIELLIKENMISKNIVNELIKRDNKVCNFYLLLNNKAHKVIKEILTCDNKPVANFIKIATSLITQGIITIEHSFDKEDINGQNNFIECVGLSDLSDGLSLFFKTGDSSKLVESVMNVKNDVKLLLD